MCVSVLGVPVVAWLSPLACVTARGKCFARVYEIKPDGLPLKSRIFPSRPLGVGGAQRPKIHQCGISRKNLTLNSSQCTFLSAVVAADWLRLDGRMET